MNALPVIPTRFKDAIQFTILTAVQAAPGYFVAEFGNDAAGHPYAAIQHIAMCEDGPSLWEDFTIEADGPRLHLWETNTEKTVGTYADANALGSRCMPRSLTAMRKGWAGNATTRLRWRPC